MADVTPTSGLSNLELRYSADVNRLGVLFAVLTVLTLGGCQHDPWAGRFLTRQPAVQDVVGWYGVDHASLQRTIKLPMNGARLNIDPSAHIVLSADHKAEFFSVPADPDGSSLCSVTGHGTWTLGNNDRYVVIRAMIADEEPNSRCRDTFTANFADELNLYGERPPYRLHVTIGDPDSGYAVQFERRN